MIIFKVEVILADDDVAGYRRPKQRFGYKIEDRLLTDQPDVAKKRVRRCIGDATDKMLDDIYAQLVSQRD